MMVLISFLLFTVIVQQDGMFHITDIPPLFKVCETKNGILYDKIWENMGKRGGESELV